MTAMKEQLSAKSQANCSTLISRDSTVQPLSLSVSSHQLGSNGANSSSPTPSPPSHNEDEPPGVGGGGGTAGAGGGGSNGVSVLE